MRVIKGGIRPPNEAKGIKMSKKTAVKDAEVEVEEVTEEVKAPTTVTPAELALAFGTDAKTMRRFLRNVTQAKAGKGGRWAIDAALVPELKERWDNRSAASATIDALPETDSTDDDSDVEELEDIDG